MTDTIRGGIAAGLAALALTCATTARGGVADTPLPTFSDGKAAQSILVVPGVIKRGRVQTDFLCTSFDNAPVDIGVEIFDTAGTRLNNVATGDGAALDVPANGTATFGTSGTAAFLESSVIAITGVAPGSARVVASSPRVRCNVLVTDNAVTPPVSLGTLTSTLKPSAGAVFPTLALPTFSNGHAASHSAFIPGAVKRGRVQTDLLCTSLAAAPVDIGVQVLGADGTLQNDVGADNGAALAVAPGASVAMGTTGTAGFLETHVIALTGVAQGALRVVTTSPDVVCTAMVLDSGVAPPASMTGLLAGAGTLP